MNGTHAGGEEERGDDGTVGVVQDVQGGKQFVLGWKASAENAGARVWRRMQFVREGEDDEEHVDRADRFSDTPGVPTWKVESRLDGRLSHVLVVAQRSPLKRGKL